MKKSTAKILTTDGPREIEGNVHWLAVGGIKHKFFIHPCLNDTILTHYPTGSRIATLGNIKLAQRVALGYSITDRAAAIVALARLEDRLGTDVINKKLAGADNVFAIINK